MWLMLTVSENSANFMLVCLRLCHVAGKRRSKKPLLIFYGKIENQVTFISLWSIMKSVYEQFHEG